MTHTITPPVGDTKHTAATGATSTITIGTLKHITDAACAFDDEPLARKASDRIALHAVTDARDAWADITVDSAVLTNGTPFHGEHRLPLARVADLMSTRHTGSRATINVDTAENELSLIAPSFQYNKSLVVTTTTPNKSTRPDHDRLVTVQATGDALNAPLALAHGITNKVKLAYDPATHQLSITTIGSDDSLTATYDLPQSLNLPSEAVETAIPCDRFVTVNDAIPDDTACSIAFGDGSSVRITYEIAGVADIAFTLRALPVTLTER
jgi:hypothetical protein